MAPYATSDNVISVPLLFDRSDLLLSGLIEGLTRKTRKDPEQECGISKTD